MELLSNYSGIYFHFFSVSQQNTKELDFRKKIKRVSFFLTSSLFFFLNVKPSAEIDMHTFPTVQSRLKSIDKKGYLSGS